MHARRNGGTSGLLGKLCLTDSCSNRLVSGERQDSAKVHYAQKGLQGGDNAWGRIECMQR